MKITKINIKAFRSIKEESISPDFFNVNIGQNNHGKTNYFEAIRWFFNNFDRGETEQKVCHISMTPRDVSVEIEFTGLQVAIDEMQNASKRTALRTLFGANDNITIRRACSFDEGKKRQLLNPTTEEWENMMGTDNAWNDLLPKLEYVHTKIKLDDLNSYKKSSPIAEMLSGVLSAIVENDTDYIAFREKFDELFDKDTSQVRVKLDELGSTVQLYLQKQFPDGTTVKFNVENPVFDDLLKNFTTKVDDGVLTDAEEKGDGMQRAIMLSIIQAYADYRRTTNVTKKFIFLIDEAELHLHPSAQRALKSALIDISQTGEQVFINTHSSVLVVEDAPNQKIFKTEKTNGITSIKEINDRDKQYLIYELLGGSPTDLLFPSNFLIVEGHSESQFLKIIRSRFYPEFTKIFIVSANGDPTQQEKSMNAINQVYLPLQPVYKNRIVMLCDKPASTDKQKDFDKFIAGYKLKDNDDYFMLSTGSLEEYYPGKWKKTPAQTKKLGEENKKVEYAEKVANEISKDEFEKDMQTVFNALTKTHIRGF